MKPGPQHCAITYPQCCGGRRDRSRAAAGPTTTRPGPPAPSDMLPVGRCPRAAQVEPVLKKRNGNFEGERLSVPGAAASRMLPSEHGDIGTRMPLLRGPQGGRCARKSDCHGPTGDRGKVSSLSGSNGPSGVPRGPSAAGLTHGLHLPLSCGERRPTGPALSLATTTLWWRSGLGQHSPQDAVKPIQDSGTICFFFFFCGSTGALHSISCAPLTTHRGLGGYFFTPH